MPKIGQLFGTNPSIAKPYDEAFREGLRSFGYVDGNNVILLPRYAHGDPRQFPVLLTELIALNVDVLVVTGTAVPAAMEATRTIPIVCPAMTDPVRDGFVASLAHPGVNLTGGYGLLTEAQVVWRQLLFPVTTTKIAAHYTEAGSAAARVFDFAPAALAR